MGHLSSPVGADELFKIEKTHTLWEIADPRQYFIEFMRKITFHAFALLLNICLIPQYMLP